MAQETTELQASGRRHSWLHFSEMAALETNPPIVVTRASGCYIYDSEGRRYFDGSSGLACVNVGHGRAEIADAVAEQFARVEYWPIWEQITEPSVRLAEKVASLAPGDLNRVFFTNSGSEAVDTAWKLARQYQRLRGNPERTAVVARDGAYHGTTFGALSITGMQSIREDFGPLVPHVFHVPKVDPYGASTDPLTHSVECASTIEDLLTGPRGAEVGAIFVEPVQNAGGSLVADREYFRRLREICDQHDILLVSDETICAWGRIGEMFGSRAMEYMPDIITTAKGITSGYIPMGAVIVSDRVAEPFLKPGTSFKHGLTYGGHPIASAAALANIEILEQENLCAESKRKGALLRRALDELRDIPIVGDVRGMGLFATVELSPGAERRSTFAPTQLESLRSMVPAELRSRGALFRAMYQGAPLLQLAPPLVASDEQLLDLVATIRDVLELATCALSHERS